MERFERATKVRLKGPHGKYLWADDDHYTISQAAEDKNQRALWRVEKSTTVGGIQTLRFKSCYDTYLTASDHHLHNISFLGFSGRRVSQMLPENVASPLAFEWEPVIDLGSLKMKSCFGTFLRGNPSLLPWRNSVTHDQPQHEKHQKWLFWEVEIVQIPSRSERSSV